MKLQLMKKVCLIAAVFSVVFYGYSYGQAGTLDSAFGVNGKVTYNQTDIYLVATTVQVDGKIIAVGRSYDSTTSQWDYCVARFDANGSIDSSFGTNGLTKIAVTPNDDIAYTAAIQTDGKIVLAGQSDGTGTSVTFFSVARCNANGTIDSSFADNGIKVIPLQGTDNKVLSIGIETDSNKIILAGYAGSVNLIPAIVRLKSNGLFDSTFANNGIFITQSTNLFSYPVKIEMQPDNKIVCLTYKTDSFSLFRLNENGTLDNSFGNGGSVLTGFPGGVLASTSIALQNDGKIVACGLGYLNSSSSNRVALARYNDDGTLDNTFGTAGREIITLNGYFNDASSVSVQPSDNKIVIAGKYSTTSLGYSHFLIARFSPDGTVDSEFGDSTGYTITTFDSQAYEGGSSIFVLPDGKLLATGFSGVSLAMSRYNSCGISITGQPANQTKGLGATASFTVGSTSTSAGYQWQTKNTSGWADLSDGGQYSGSQSATLQVSNITVANDQQQFRAIALSGVCSDTSSTALLAVDTTLGIGRIALNTGFRLYPNPVNEHLTIATKALSDRIVEVTITDLAGKIIVHRQLKGQSSVTLSTKTWAAGMYIAKVRLKGKAPQAVKLVKK